MGGYASWGVTDWEGSGPAEAARWWGQGSKPVSLSLAPLLILQLAATCNVEPSLFIDWFSGHLNFQIEHQ